jgi:flagellar basal-body rod protein FlgC
MQYEPGHPDANADGYVAYPDINVVEEMANMITAMRSYEASSSSIGTVKSMFNKALEIGR